MVWADVAEAHGMHRTDLYQPHGTDKGAHGYIDHYQRILLGRDVRSLLEIGVQSGASLAMWTELLPAARIVGIDIDPECGAVDGPHELVIGDAGDPDAMGMFDGDKFDVIIDDGSHAAAHTRTNLDVWASRLADGGVYVIEDAVFGSTSWIQSVAETVTMLMEHGLTPFLIARSAVPWVAHQHYGGMMAIIFADRRCDIPS